MEHLNIYRLGGKILDASWGKFMFSYKAERAGRMVVDPKGGPHKNLPDGSSTGDYHSRLPNPLPKGWDGPK